MEAKRLRHAGDVLGAIDEYALAGHSALPPMPSISPVTASTPACIDQGAKIALEGVCNNKVYF